MRTCRLQHVYKLNLSHQSEVALENLIDECLEIILVVDSQFNHAKQKDDKIEFMPCSIINSLKRAEGFKKIGLEFRDRFLDRDHLLKHCIGIRGHTLQPSAE